jgi:hypothetical protein
MPVVDGKHYAYTPAGQAAAGRARNARPGRDSQASLFGRNSRQKPPVHTHGTFNPAGPTENIHAREAIDREDVV